MDTYGSWSSYIQLMLPPELVMLWEEGSGLHVSLLPPRRGHALLPLWQQAEGKKDEVGTNPPKIHNLWTFLNEPEAPDIWEMLTEPLALLGDRKHVALLYSHSSVLALWILLSSEV